MSENELIEKTETIKLKESFIDCLPKANRYIDPFFPGFGFLPSDKFKQFALNIPNQDLYRFLKIFRSPEVQSELKLFIEAFPLLTRFSNEVTEELKVAITDFFDNNINQEDLSYMVRVIVVMNIDSPQFAPLFNERFIIYLDRFIDLIEKNLTKVSLSSKETIAKNTLNKLVEDALIIAFNDHWISVAKDHKDGKTHNISEPKYLTVKFICDFLDDNSWVKKLKSFYSCYKTDLAECLKSILAVFNHIPQFNSIISSDFAENFFTSINLNKNDVVFIDIEEQENVALINNIIELIHKHQCQCLILQSNPTIKLQFPHFSPKYDINIKHTKYQLLANF